MNKIIVLSITLMMGYVGVQFIGGAVSAVSNCVGIDNNCGTKYRPKYTNYNRNY